MEPGPSPNRWLRGLEPDQSSTHTEPCPPRATEPHPSPPADLAPQPALLEAAIKSKPVTYAAPPKRSIKAETLPALAFSISAHSKNTGQTRPLRTYTQCTCACSAEKEPKEQKTAEAETEEQETKGTKAEEKQPEVRPALSPLTPIVAPLRPQGSAFSPCVATTVAGHNCVPAIT
eukprot:scaffold86192_cov74-Phaeocystis_antarctica.AAC.1